jgi:GDP-fucose transporter C1
MTAGLSRQVGAVALYMLTSVALVFFNKAALRGFPCPLSLTWLQMLVTLPLVLAVRRRSHGTALFDGADARAALPAACVYTAMVASGNLCLHNVHASSYQIARSMHLIFSVMLSALLGTRTPAAQLAACVVITGGYVCGAASNARFSSAGLLHGTAASALTALNALLTKRTLARFGDDTWRLQQYTAAYSLLTLPALAAAADEPALWRTVEVRDGALWLCLLGGGALGFGLSFAAANSVKHTSPLAHMVAGSAKGALQTVLAPAVFGTRLDLREQLGTLVCVLGSAGFAALRIRSATPPKERRE